MKAPLFFISPFPSRLLYTPLYMILDIEGVTAITIEHSRKAKRMRITVSSGSVRVAVPRWISLDKAKAFVLEHADWIRHHEARLKLREKAGEELLRELPPIADPDEARQKIIYRCRLLALHTGLSFKRLTIRSQKTRWGSCSARNDISLNIKLARLPQALMDYVILHELVHTRVKGHGPAFWNELDKYAGDSRKLRRELRKYLLKNL